MAAIAAAEVARSANIGVIMVVKFIASNGLGSLETTIVLPGIKIFLEENKDFLTKLDLPFGRSSLDKKSLFSSRKIRFS